MSELASLNCGLCGEPKFYILAQGKELTAMCARCGHLHAIGEADKELLEENKAVQ